MLLLALLMMQQTVVKIRKNMLISSLKPLLTTPPSLNLDSK